MDVALLLEFKELITRRSGLQLREQEEGALRRALATRMKALRLATPAEYLVVLKKNGAHSLPEWRELWVLLTNQESYFFRDVGQFALLRETVLPGLIEANRDRRTLRLWSAGCSTGEEPYSLAMLVDQLLPQRDDWKIFIIGTDLSEAALVKARRGIYGSWSFRMKDDELLQRYFRKTSAGFELNARIRDMVAFQHGNLLQDEFPEASALHSMDLIVCRNVFIYFAREAVDRVVHKFARTLRLGGYFLSGHAELHNMPPETLQPQLFAGTVIYQRSDKKQPLVTTVPVRAALNSRIPAPRLDKGQARGRSAEPASNGKSSDPASARTEPKQARNSSVAGMDAEALLKAAEALLQRGSYVAAADTLRPLLGEKRHFAAVVLAAQAYANGGDYEQAILYCREAQEMDAFAPEPYHLLAHVAEERGEIDEAKALLKKVIYLAPGSVAAYLDLDAIYEREGDSARAAKMRAAALGALQDMAADAVVPRYEGRNAGQLRDDLRLKLRG